MNLCAENGNVTLSVKLFEQSIRREKCFLNALHLPFYLSLSFSVALAPRFPLAHQLLPNNYSNVGESLVLS